jgi:hypothetical protein
MFLNRVIVGPFLSCPLYEGGRERPFSRSPVLPRPRRGGVGVATLAGEAEAQGVPDCVRAVLVGLPRSRLAESLAGQGRGYPCVSGRQPGENVNGDGRSAQRRQPSPKCGGIRCEVRTLRTMQGEGKPRTWPGCSSPSRAPDSEGRKAIKGISLDVLLRRSLVRSGP